MVNDELLIKINKTQNIGVSLMKVIGVILLNPLTAGAFTAVLVNVLGGHWWYMWIPAYAVLAIVYMVGFQVIVGLVIQLLSIRLYKKMTPGEEKDIAYKLIKEKR